MASSDPRRASGEIRGGSPSTRRSAVVETTNALLLDGMNVCILEDGELPTVAIELQGRINRTKDRVNMLVITGPDGCAALVTEIMAVGRRMGGEFEQEFTRRLAELTAAGNMEKKS